MLLDRRAMCKSSCSCASPECIIPVVKWVLKSPFSWTKQIPYPMGEAEEWLGVPQSALCHLLCLTPRSILAAPLTAPLLTQWSWSSHETWGPPGTCCCPCATAAAATSAPSAPPSTTPAALTTQALPRAGGGRSFTLESCTSVGKCPAPVPAQLLVALLLFLFFTQHKGDA